MEKRRGIILVAIALLALLLIIPTGVSASIGSDNGPPESIEVTPGDGAQFDQIYSDRDPPPAVLIHTPQGDLEPVEY